MNHAQVSAAAMLGLLALIAGCAVEPVGAGYAPSAGYGTPYAGEPGYFAPVDLDYGGWGGGFEVGPYGSGGGERFHGGSRQHAFHPAAPGRRAPSIPHVAHQSGGGRPGGSNQHRP